MTSLPKLNEKLEILECSNNQLTYLPKLNKNLEYLFCDDNELTSLPHLTETIYVLVFDNNPICKIINKPTQLESEIVNEELKIQIQTFNNFRYLYYSLHLFTFQMPTPKGRHL